MQHSRESNSNAVAKEQCDLEQRGLWSRLKLAGFALLAIFLLLFLVSGPFEYGSQESRPMLLVVGLLLVATLFAALAMRWAVKIQGESRHLLLLIVCVAISARAVAVLTTPILEIDYYRYLWDGKVCAIGVSPYRYSPRQVLEAGSTDDPILKRLATLATESNSNRVILERIHFGNYTTIYPPVSQFVFAAAMKWFPSSASVTAHVIWLKAVIVGFDMMSLGVVYLLLVRFKFHVGWLIGYAWNPLVIKEFANSGHLDSIAVLLLMVGIYFLTHGARRGSTAAVSWACMLSAAAFGVGVGAKLFPIVLVPAALVILARDSAKNAIVFALIFIAISAATLWPMYRQISFTDPGVQSESAAGASEVTIDVMVADEGLTSFLTQWRMNDVVFSGIYRNLKPDAQPEKPANQPWYVITSNQQRQSCMAWIRKYRPDDQNPAFLLTRLVTLVVFGVFYAFQLVMIYRSSKTDYLDRLLWILVVFLFLQPTVNPWYWTWVAPLACLSRNHGWLAVSGLLMIYYTRFWFGSFDQSHMIGGIEYSSVGLFDHFVAWIEFALIVAVILWFRTYRIRQLDPA